MGQIMTITNLAQKHKFGYNNEMTTFALITQTPYALNHSSCLESLNALGVDTVFCYGDGVLLANALCYQAGIPSVCTVLNAQKRLACVSSSLARGIADAPSIARHHLKGGPNLAPNFELVGLGTLVEHLEGALYVLDGRGEILQYDTHRAQWRITLATPHPLHVYEGISLAMTLASFDMAVQVHALDVTLPCFAEAQGRSLGLLRSFDLYDLPALLVSNPKLLGENAHLAQAILMQTDAVSIWI